HFRVVKSELVTPKLLACPMDKQRTALAESGGNAWSALDGDRNISFFVGLDAGEARPQTILAGDRNVFGGGGGLDLTWSPALGTSIDATWDNTQHENAGFILLSDGSVQHTTTPQLREHIGAVTGSGTNVIFSLPRGVQ